MSIDYTSNPLGDVTFDDAAFGRLMVRLTEHAYASNYGTDGGVRYYARAERFGVASNAGDGINGTYFLSWAAANTAVAALYGEDWADAAEPEAGILPESYMVAWETTEAWDAMQRAHASDETPAIDAPNSDDESLACDWDSPVSVRLS